MKSDDSRQDVRIRIIGAASGLGAQDQACEDGPVAFHRSQVWHELAHHPRIDWGRTLFPPDEGAPAGRIAVLCRHLANEVEQTLNALRSHQMPDRNLEARFRRCHNLREV